MAKSKNYILSPQRAQRTQRKELLFTFSALSVPSVVSVFLFFIAEGYQIMQLNTIKEE